MHGRARRFEQETLPADGGVNEFDLRLRRASASEITGNNNFGE